MLALQCHNANIQIFFAGDSQIFECQPLNMHSLLQGDFTFVTRNWYFSLLKACSLNNVQSEGGVGVIKDHHHHQRSQPWIWRWISGQKKPGQIFFKHRTDFFQITCSPPAPPQWATQRPSAGCCTGCWKRWPSLPRARFPSPRPQTRCQSPSPPPPSPAGHYPPPPPPCLHCLFCEKKWRAADWSPPANIPLTQTYKKREFSTKSCLLLRKFNFSIIRINPPHNHLDGLIDLECDIALDGLDKTGTARLLSTTGDVVNVVPQPSVLSWAALLLLLLRMDPEKVENVFIFWFTKKMITTWMTKHTVLGRWPWCPGWPWWPWWAWWAWQWGIIIFWFSPCWRSTYFKNRKQTEKQNNHSQSHLARHVYQ